MGMRGQLGKADFGYSVPVDAPLYEPFPLYYEDVSILMYPYATSAAAAARLLPSQLELAPVAGDSAGTLAGAEMVFAKYGFSNVGAYNEVAQVVAAIYRGSDPTLAGQPVSYAVRLHVNNDMAMSAGREIGGFPKKLGHISFEEAPTYLSTLESPHGLRICSGELHAFAKLGEQKDFPPAMQQKVMPFLSLRVVPDPASITAPYTPSLCQLIYTEWVLTDGAFWAGRGQLCLTGASDLHPYHSLPVIAQAPPMSPQAAGTGLFRGKMTIGKVKVLESF
ncbi:MAG: acetoacetate decarboxylase family protein [Vicinamibacterales bacterium]